MPSLKQFRSWLSGKPVPGLPDRCLDTSPEEYISKAKYDVRVDGKDARLKFGKWSGSLLSSLALSGEGKDYLAWLGRQDFPDELKRLAKAHYDPSSDEAHQLGLGRTPPKRKNRKGVVNIAGVSRKRRNQ